MDTTTTTVMFLNGARLQSQLFSFRKYIKSCDVINMRFFRNICEESHPLVVNLIFLFSCFYCNMFHTSSLAELCNLYRI